MPQNPQGANVAVNAGLSRVPLKSNVSGSLSVNQYLGHKFEMAKSKILFSGGNVGGATLSAALATTYVGCCLSNPAASTVNLLLRRVTGITIVAPATFLALGLITGWASGGITVHTTPITVLKPSNVGDLTVVPQAKLDAACTLVGASSNAPGWSLWFASEAATGGNPNFNLDLEAGVLIPPGGYAAIGANVAGPTAGFLGSFEWIEAPLTA